MTGFKTDTDISAKLGMRRERELQAWQPDAGTGSGTGAGTGTGSSPSGAGDAGPVAAVAAGANTGTAGPNARGNLDDLTFGPGASGPGNDWDQFAANEALFGVKVDFNEEAYTTHLDRNAPDYKEKERKAAQLASEIMRVGFFFTFQFLATVLILSLVGYEQLACR